MDHKFKEEKIKSPVDGSENCFRVFTEPISDDHYLCMTTGYMSTSHFKVGSVQLESELEKSPELVKALQQFDSERDIVWIPTILNIPGKGMIYPEGNIGSWNWCYASVVQIPEEEQKNYPVPDKEGEYYTSKLDVENSQKFNNNKFYEACTAMGLIAQDHKGSLMNA